MRIFKTLRSLVKPATLISIVFAVFATSLAHAQTEYGNSITRTPNPDTRLDDRGSNASAYISKSEVVRQVKREYDAQVLKVTLNEQRGVYDVRVLMPNGKVRNLTVSAKR